MTYADEDHQVLMLKKVDVLRTAIEQGAVRSLVVGIVDATGAIASMSEFKDEDQQLLADACVEAFDDMAEVSQVIALMSMNMLYTKQEVEQYLRDHNATPE